MKTRIISSFAGLGILFAALYLYRTIAFDILVCVVYLIAVHEIHSAFKDKSSAFLTIAIGVIGCGIILKQYLGFISVDLVVCLFVLVYAGSVVLQFHSIDFKNVSAALCFELYVLAGIYSLMSMKVNMPYRQFGYDSAFMMLLAMGIAWGGDVSAYFAGYFFGKHKMAPVLSPKKTVEGAVGGIAGSVFFGFLFLWIYTLVKPVFEGTGNVYSMAQANLLQLALICVVGSCISIIGDLFASAVKRQVGIKDYGKIMPGHGGVLDRFDSFLLLMPFISLLSAFVVNRGGVFCV